MVAEVLYGNQSVIGVFRLNDQKEIERFGRLR